MFSKFKVKFKFKRQLNSRVDWKPTLQRKDATVQYMRPAFKSICFSFTFVCVRCVSHSTMLLSFFLYIRTVLRFFSLSACVGPSLSFTLSLLTYIFYLSFAMLHPSGWISTVFQQPVFTPMGPKDSISCEVSREPSSFLHSALEDIYPNLRLAHHTLNRQSFKTSPTVLSPVGVGQFALDVFCVNGLGWCALHMAG